MRPTLRRPPGATSPPCPPNCWSCHLGAARPPATPVTVLLVGRVLLRLRRPSRAGRPDARGTRPATWPLSSWWDEALG